MKKMSICTIACLLFSFQAVAQNDRTLQGITENQQLGMMAGLALACDAGGKLDDYELIASRIIANQAQTDADERKAVREYAEYKFGTFKEQKENPQASCGEVLDTFSHLPIFKATVYADGSVKMPDGRLLKPREGSKLPMLKVKKKQAQNAQAKKAAASASKTKKATVKSRANMTSANQNANTHKSSAPRTSVRKINTMN